MPKGENVGIWFFNLALEQAIYSYLRQDNRGNTPFKVGAWLENLRPEQRERLKHLRAEDIPCPNEDSMRAVTWPYNHFRMGEIRNYR